MKPTTHLRWLVAGVFACAAFAATAQSTSVAVQAEADRAPATAQADRDIDRHCLRHTGTRVTTRQYAKHDAQPGAKRRCAIAAGRVYTRDDIDRTGRIDIADALRVLDPSIR